MAELVLKTQCRSVLRESCDKFLNFSFPVWGVISPLMAIGCTLGAIGYMQSANQAEVLRNLAYASALLTFSLSCLLSKRALGLDLLTVDRNGLRLPFFVGNKLRKGKYYKWDELLEVSAIVLESDLPRSYLAVKPKKGKVISLPVKQLPQEFVEQLILALGLWAPQVSQSGLESLQDKLRITASSEKASYTQIWEEELARRFCPTSYLPLELGKVLRNNSLKVIKHLSSGGLSALYLCQLDGNKLVVLKEAVVPNESPENVKEKARELFEREARLLMKIDHPGIVKVLDFFTEDERNYLLLEYINGMDLRQLVMQNGAQKEDDVLQWALQIATTLKYLHERDPALIHRDLTPDNIVMRNDGKLFIVDFGAANEFIGTATGTFVGKHAYIAPEQLRGKASTSSDIYAFGCSLYFLLCGEDPEALSPSVPLEKNKEISAELSELVESCTQLEASERYQSVAQLLPVLRRLAAQSMVS